MSDANYTHQIRQLVDLQKVDDEIFEVKCTFENAPKDLDTTRRHYEELDQRRKVLLDKISHLNEQKKRISLELEDDSARIKKSKNKMMSVGNSREYQAMVREMDNMEKSSRNREEERTTLLEELQRQEENLAEMDSSYTAIKEEMQQKSESLEQTLNLAKDRLAVLESQRKQFGAGIPAPIFRRYEFIRHRLEHPVIVGVNDGVCSGCHIAVPPQTFIELQRGQQILNCPNCQRLIYWSEHFEDGGSPASAKNTNDASSSSKKAPEGTWPEDELVSNGENE